MTSEELRAALRPRLESHERLALCLDFDGTLAPIVSEPDDAALPEETRQILQRLVDTPAVDVAVISGRALQDVRSRIGIDGIDFAGNHGIELEQDGELEIHPAAKEHRDDLEQACDRIEEQLASMPGCFIEDKYATATVHYRRADTDDTRLVKDIVDRVVEKKVGLKTTSGNKIIEIRPDVDQGKGAAVDALVNESSGTLAAYIGDDETDVDAFRALAKMDGESVRIAVGQQRPKAEFLLGSPREVQEFLGWLADEISAE